jgi:N-succinyldiaminopimelate aminotransferase
VRQTNSVLGSYGTTIFEVMSRLAKTHDAINLGQGFPDTTLPESVIAKAAEGLTAIPNQYPPMLGLPELRQAVARHDRRFQGIEADWQTQVMVTTGATEALAAALFALIEPGDEVVLIEPLYDSYMPIVRRAGGLPKLVRVSPPNWTLDPVELAAAFSARTKLILINTPQNPAAKVYSEAELSLIADLVKKYDCFALCDEVYEHIVFAPERHVSLMTLPGMADRVIRIGSAGKTFSLTGWKVGYITASAEIVERIARAHQFLVFTTAPNLQYAVAHGLDLGDEYYDGLLAEMRIKRDRFASGLARAGFEALPCGGTYFINVDIRSIGFDGNDEAFCRYITETVGVAAIPVSAFYADPATAPQHLARFCFAKKDAVLDSAIDRLAGHFQAKAPAERSAARAIA